MEVMFSGMILHVLLLKGSFSDNKMIDSFASSPLFVEEMLHMMHWVEVLLHLCI